MRRGLVLLLLAAGCAHPALVPRGWIGTPSARQVGYLHLANWTEQTPGGVAHDAVLDEATLASLGDGVACVDLVERTGVDYDEPIAEMAPVCKTGVHQRGAVTDEKITVRDYDFVTNEVVARIRDVTPFGFQSVRLEQPTSEIFRVIERRARLCCPLAGSSRVDVVVKNPRLRVNDVGASFGEAFSWRVQ